MARNEEKAQSMLHRYLRSRAGGDDSSQFGRPRGAQRRPYLATLCEDVDEAQRWYRQVVRDISSKVSEIQNPGLGDSRTRELNDEINKLIRESRHWARRVRDLGGHIQQSANEATLVAGQASSHKGYFYFGAARDLPGVAALLDGKKKQKSIDQDEIGEHSLEQLSRRIDSQKYFGFEDIELKDAERERESNDVQEAVSTWELCGGSPVDAPWDTAWEQFVGQVPPVGKELEAELDRIALERSKAELCEEVELMQ